MIEFHTYDQIVDIINSRITLDARVTVRFHIIESNGTNDFTFNVDVISTQGNEIFAIKKFEDYGEAYSMAEDFYIQLAYLYESNDFVRVLEEIKREKAKSLDNTETKTQTVELKKQSTPDPSEIKALLEGFEFTATKGMPEIYVGKRNRLYLKGAFKGMFGIKSQTRIIIGYNVVEDAFAVVKPEAIRYNREAQAAGYFVSLRYDVTATKMFRQYNLDKYEGQTYYFDKASSDASVAIFRRY